MCIFKDVSFPINFSGHTPHVLKNVKTLTTGIEMFCCNVRLALGVQHRPNLACDEERSGPLKKKVWTDVRSCQNK